MFWLRNKIINFNYRPAMGDTKNFLSEKELLSTCGDVPMFVSTLLSTMMSSSSSIMVHIAPGFQ